MCGITGYLWTSGTRPPTHHNFDFMTDRLSHRGPDGRGVHRIEHDDGSGISLGHRRLSVIDLDSGRQPMSNEDGTIWVTFNGEIYNYRELRDGLKSRGHQFRTLSDTEVIVHLYQQYGDDCVTHLRGMFAFAIWDDRQRRLFIARDRMGQKPLVYYQANDRLIFASELKSILASGNVPAVIRPQAVDEYFLYGYIPHPGTIYQNISKLPPAHFATWQDGRFEIHQYWNPSRVPDASASPEHLQDQLRHALNESVRLRLRSDVPLGSFLSGGIDSTIITGCMQQQSQANIQSYSIGFADPRYDESEFAAEAAAHLGTQHHRLVVQPDSLEVLDKLVQQFDEPFADSSAVPMHYLSELTRQHVTVAMTGDGGDELFCGYDRYQTIDGTKRFDAMPAAARRLLTGPWVRFIPGHSEKSFGRRLRQRLQLLGRPLNRRYLNWATGSPPSMRSQIYRDDFSASINGEASEAFVANLMSLLDPSVTPGVRAMRTDSASYLPCDLLTKVDITSMTHSLECRSPFLDHHVVEAAYQIPFQQLTKANRVKPFLVDAFAEHLTPRLRNRPKMGFSVPLDRWFRTDLRDYARDHLLASDATCHQFLSPNAIERMLDDHHHGQWNHGGRIWSLLFFERWGQLAKQGCDLVKA